MMKGSNNTQGGYSQGQQSGYNVPSLMKTGMAYMLAPQYGSPFTGPFAGSGTKGSVARPQEPAPVMPQMPQYVNYQQTPTYGDQSSSQISGQSYGPSQAILNFLSSNYGSGYASGGAAKEKSFEDDIEAAMRIVRLLGELKKS